MSQAFAARYSITYVEDKGSGVWEVTGKIYDDGFTSYTAIDVATGDVFVDESAFYGTTNRWVITSIISASGRDLVCQVVWDDTGTADANGPQPSEAAIGRPDASGDIMEIPTQAFAKISENVQTRLQNIDSRKNIGPGLGGGSVTFKAGISPNGTRDGVNDTFTLPSGNYTAGTITVYLNGLQYDQSNIVESSPYNSFQISGDTLPIATDSLRINYIEA